jgi:hypothetical protein
VISGCTKKKVSVIQQWSSGETTTTITEDETKTGSTDGTYKGISSVGACEFNFEIQVTDGLVKGTGMGTGQGGISCKVDLVGMADEKNNMNGQANGTYTAITQGDQIDWYLAGKFNLTMIGKTGGNLIIDLQGIGNTCPPKIPCTNENDNITAVLTKL